MFVNGVEEVTCIATRVLAGPARSRDDSSQLLNLGCFIPPFRLLGEARATRRFGQPKKTHYLRNTYG